MHIDMPTRDDVTRIASLRDPLCVTIYVPTSPLPTESEHNLLQARALFDAAMEVVRDTADKDDADAVQVQFDDLLEDAYFWTNLGRSLAIFLTPTSALELRLPNELEAQFAVGDRFAITSLLRAVTFPQAAFVLALSQNGARLVEVSADGPAQELPVADMPDDAASVSRLTSIAGPTQGGRLQGDEGRKVRIAQYAHVAEDAITGNPDALTEEQLADSAREILDAIYAKDLKELHETFFELQANGLASSDLSDLARAAAFGAIDILAIDMNAEVAGSVTDGGALELDTEHDALEDIARLALLSGAQVLALREDDMPGELQATGILRYSF